MLHEQVRQARIEHGLSQLKLAELARVPRSQLRKFEKGEGITMTTFFKILSQLPDLRRLTIGPTELQLQNVDLGALRDTLTELIAAAAGVLAVIQSTSSRTGPEMAAPHPSTVTEQQRAEELNTIAAALARGGKTKDRSTPAS